MSPSGVNTASGPSRFGLIPSGPGAATTDAGPNSTVSTAAARLPVAAAPVLLSDRREVLPANRHIQVRAGLDPYHLIRHLKTSAPGRLLYAVGSIAVGR
jgi:hypothetical protein